MSTSMMAESIAAERFHRPRPRVDYMLPDRMDAAIEYYRSAYGPIWPYVVEVRASFPTVLDPDQERYDRDPHFHAFVHILGMILWLGFKQLDRRVQRALS